MKTKTLLIVAGAALLVWWFWPSREPAAPQTGARTSSAPNLVGVQP